MLHSLSFPIWPWGVCAPAVGTGFFWVFGWWSNAGIQPLAREGALGAPDTAGAGTCTASALVAAESSLCQYTVLQPDSDCCPWGLGRLKQSWGAASVLEAWVGARQGHLSRQSQLLLS